ncbi:translational GTPase TypA [Varunaivibrio sulfuroxidans]|uniref:Large ribosomal subunit assembly factor BipA n=1 Tax=Varunaivibrio sulfuroxidans TaxID=1773489 RepID=A0A4R3JJ91_9PROT|nr:translational GTPase TypA [Varunaivibrio sulfuroxidans]TCS64920.1 GTP-binding protein [Varunaivibrio sulfuroxidans]WES29786.1 translational GTPase TypA [Varunaivibrio sulfuroxidans]
MDIRNIAIIAHVDHGKTTLVDVLLRQSGSFRENQQVAERAMDSGELERERGITILAKPTSVEWKGTRINIVDTPGHADFGGEVERILSMVDGVLLLVDAAEGAMPQTKFVTAKALKLGLRPIVVVNKVDKPEQRAYEVQDEVFDLFSALDANDQQLDFPTLFASAKNGWAAAEPEGPRDNMDVIFETILSHVPAPTIDEDSPFSMLAVTLESDPFLGRILTGRVATGIAKPNTTVKVLNREGKLVEQGRISKLLAFRGLERVPADEVRSGDLVAIAGLTKATVADTLCDPQIETPLHAQPVDPPTLAMTFSVNDSPLAGTEGTKVTSRMIRDRLFSEAEGNVALRVTEAENKDAFEVAGRGELQLGVLIEQMRREGFELTISRPRVLIHEDPESGQKTEPLEEVTVDVDEEYSGIVVEALSLRKGQMKEMRPSGGGKVRLIFHVPSRGMIGYYGEFLTETRGTGIMARVFHDYVPHVGLLPGRRNGVLVSNAAGATVAYGLAGLEGRGPLFIGSGVKVYTGMIIGEHSRAGDLEVNPMKSKQLTNVRASGTDEAVRLTPPRRMSLEQSIAYIENDELVEVTPKNIRLRKRYLDPHERKRNARAEKA